MTKPFAEMTYDEQRAALGLGDGPPRGYAMYRARLRYMRVIRESEHARQHIRAAALTFAEAAAQISLERSKGKNR